MGMFDEFAPKEKIVCSTCGTELRNSDPDSPYKWMLQSKALDCLLLVYIEGGPITLKGEDKDLAVINGWIRAYDFCEKCKKAAYFKLIIENGIWTKTENWNQ